MNIAYFMYVIVQRRAASAASDKQYNDIR